MSLGSNTLMPVTSEGSRSGVNWMRPKRPEMDAARERASRVLPGAGHVLQQGVAAGKEGAEQELDLRVLAHDHPLNVFLDFFCQCLYL